MKNKKRKLSTILILALLTISIASAYAPPPMPHQFYGNVTIDGAPAPAPVLVEAYINDVCYASTYTVDSQYGHDEQFNVIADDPETPEVDGGQAGDIVKFYVDGFLATSFVFENGGSTLLDLEISTTTYEIQLYAGWNLIGIPFIPEDPSIVVMLSNILPYVESVWTYEAETGSWLSYNPPAPSFLTEIRDGKGYWIKVTTDVIWVTTSS